MAESRGNAPAARRTGAAEVAARVVPVALAVAVGLLIWAFLIRDDGGGGVPTVTPATAPRAVSEEELVAFARGANEPVYWLGPRDGGTYELTDTGDRRYLRYLPEGVAAGDERPDFPAVGTYRVPGALDALRALGRKERTRTARVPGGGLAYWSLDRPRSVYVAYPGSDAQIEVYDPDPAAARRAALSGQLAPIVAVPGAARVATPASLRALSRRLGHPVYWAGPPREGTLEVSEAPGGRVYVRYLTGGAAPGDPRAAFLTVATYPYADAFAVLQDVARSRGVTPTARPDGGIVVPAETRTSVHVAFPGVGYQVEVFDPSPARALETATSRLRPAG